MRPKSTQWISLALLCVLPLAASGEDDRYRVELIVFETWGLVDPLYRWPGEPDVGNAIDLTPEERPLEMPSALVFGDAASLTAADQFRLRAGSTPPGRTPAPVYARNQQPGDFAAGADQTALPAKDDEIRPDDELTSRDFEQPNRTTLLPEQSGTELPDQPTPFEPLEQVFRLLPPEEFVLAGAWDRLSRSPDYRPLIHMAWTQPAAPFGEPQPVRIHGGPVVFRQDRDPSFLLMPVVSEPAVVETVDGVVALERGRYLHLRLDLALHQKNGDRRAHPSDFETQRQAGDYLTQRLIERRQITDNTINYFDHKHFGVIASVIRVEDTDADPDAP